MHPQQARMSRSARTWRGMLGAFAATMLAAASHALAGGELSWLGILATALVALPLCVALAGREGSLWRLALGVSASQFVYHWSFAGLGAAPVIGSGAADGPALAAFPAHAGHLARFSPEFAAAPDAWMWVSHAMAAALTIAVLHRGERAATALAGLLRRAMPVAPPRATQLPERPAILVSRAPERGARTVIRSAIALRGPPSPSFSPS